MEQQGRPFEIRMVNLQEAAGLHRYLSQNNRHAIAGYLQSDAKKGWTLGSPQLMVGMHAVIRLLHPRQVRLLRSILAQSRPDMVVSLVPNFNRALGESLRARFPGRRW